MKLRNLLAAAVVCTGAAFGAGAQTPTADSPPSTSRMAAMQAHMQAHVQKHLDRIAASLKLSDAQQPAWQAFSAAVKDLYTPPSSFPAKGSDAATLTRFNANMATARAQKATAVADAMDTLQAGASPAQKEILRHSVLEAMHRMHGGMHGHDGGDMPHGGEKAQ